MITKTATFKGVSESGEPLVQLFRPEAFDKLAAPLHPVVQSWLSSYKPQPGKIALLVNALGASEFYGQNCNGDLFPWEALSHECDAHCWPDHPIDDFTGKRIPPYGYRTFLDAHGFAHHRNKDSSRAFGTVALAVLNDRMKRVELVVIIDTEKARREGAGHVVDRILAGEYPDVSMGARVPYDVCTVCGHKSKTRADYCIHVTDRNNFGMGNVLSDGRRIGVINWYPRFFDISFVFIGADKTAKVMSKLGSAILTSSEESDLIYGPAIQTACLGCVGSPRACASCGIVKAAAVEIGPPPSRNRSEYPYVGTIDFQGIHIYVENRAGDVREGTGPGGKKWSTKMQYPYGEILGTKGTDKDRLDVYVGPNEQASMVYVVHQNHPGNHPKAGRYDEDKCMLGFDSAEKALAAYLKHYDREDFFRSLTSMPIESFKKMIKGEVKGEKVAHSLKKEAADMRLEDLFGKKAGQRVRIWKDSDGKVAAHNGPGFTKEAGIVRDGIEAVLQNKIAAKRKLSEILKEVDPDGVTGRVVRELDARQDDIPKDVLNRLGSEDLSKVLSTTSGMGMVLKPREFQRIVLVCSGRPDIADDLDSGRKVFSPVEGGIQAAEMSNGNFASSIMKGLLPFLEGRSFLEPVVKRRVIRISITGPVEKDDVEVNSPLLSKIGQAYNWYRDEMLKVAAEADSIVWREPELRAAVAGVTDEDLFSMKTAEALDAKRALITVSAIPLTLMASSQFRSDQAAGQRLDMLERLIANHPILSALGATAIMRKLMKTRMGKNIVDSGFKVAGDVVKDLRSNAAKAV